MIRAPDAVDLCVIGASEAGVAACMAATALALSVTLVDDGDPDGLPSPDMMLERLRVAAMAFQGHPAGSDEAWSKVAADLRRPAADRRHARLAAMNVRLVAGRGRFGDGGTVIAGSLPITPRRIILAVGGRQPAASLAAALHPSRRLTIAGLGQLDAPPRDAVVLGGGPSAVSAAQSLQRLSSRVVLVADHLLPGLDDDLAAPLLTQLARDGVRLLTGVRPQLCRPSDQGVDLTVSDGTVVRGSHLLLADEPEPALDGLDLGRAGIATDGGSLVLDRSGRTTNRRVFAVGRAAGAPSTAAGVAAVGPVLRAAFFHVATSPRRSQVATVTATDPQVATVGLLERDAAPQGSVRIWRWPLAHTAAGAVGPASPGFVKVVTGRRGEILGAGLVGPDVREMLGFWSLAVSQRLTLSQVADVALPSPSLSEAARAIALSHLAARLGAPVVRRALRAARWFG